MLSIATATLSAILTAQFMYGIGLAMGEPVLMTTLGIVLDFAKCATPMFVLFLFSQKQYVSAFFALALSLTLSLVSFSASVAALEQGVVASQKIVLLIKPFLDKLKNIKPKLTSYVFLRPNNKVQTLLLNLKER
uniref:hypothetical protein n=1 Tax=Aliivibrio fischeri TaxID=668 RepID=UPI001F1651AE|nr:hypothetical protein [Aliivibrio fischeri]